jgi:hypothetical protein
LFDWIDESGRDLGDTYEERLRVEQVLESVDLFAREVIPAFVRSLEGARV